MLSAGSAKCAVPFFGSILTQRQDMIYYLNDTMSEYDRYTEIAEGRYTEYIYMKPGLGG
jgi:hypothetical protein